MDWWKDFSATVQSFATVIVAALGGIWAYWKFGLGQERFPHIETAADIQFVGQHGKYWIDKAKMGVELLRQRARVGPPHQSIKNC